MLAVPAARCRPAPAMKARRQSSFSTSSSASRSAARSSSAAACAPPGSTSRRRRCRVTSASSALVKGGADGAYQSPLRREPNGQTARAVLQRALSEQLAAYRPRAAAGAAAHRARPGAVAVRRARRGAAAGRRRHAGWRGHDSHHRARCPPGARVGQAIRGASWWIVTIDARWVRARAARDNGAPSRRILLAYAGSLDASAAIAWLAERLARRRRHADARRRPGTARRAAARPRPGVRRCACARHRRA